MKEKTKMDWLKAVLVFPHTFIPCSTDVAARVVLGDAQRTDNDSYSVDIGWNNEI